MSDDALMTAHEVAARFNVQRSWVYAHADELGVVRLGRGPKPRLRFDPAVVAQLLLPATGRAPRTRPYTHMRAGMALLRVGPARQRRTLGRNR